MVNYRPSRRVFMTQVGAFAVAAGTAPMWLEMINGRPSWAFGASDALPSGTPICVHIALDGGNDYLNMLAPVGDSWYHDPTYGHGTIALTEANTLALTGNTYRLHQKLPWLANRWNNVGDVGFALGVGELSNWDFSHFDSQRYWSCGAIVPTTASTGWLGRYNDLKSPDNPLACVSINDVRLDALSATSSTLVVQDVSQYKWNSGAYDQLNFLNSAKAMATNNSGGTIGDVARMMSTTFDVADRITAANDPTVLGPNPSQWSSITQQLMQVALLVRAGIPSQTYTLAVGNHDSHINQLQMQDARFSELNEGLTHFFTALAGHERERDVFVLITSEFGRQVSVNKDNGTDHGQAGMAIFIGGGVQRGVFGQPPTLDPGGTTRPNRINDALKPTVDFRSVHATALNHLAKGDTNASQSVLGGTYEDLGVFAAPAGGGTTTTAAGVTTTTVKPTTTTAKPTTTTTVKPTTTTTAPNAKPSAVMTLSKQTGKAPLFVLADGSNSFDSDGSIKSYLWSWGDGTAKGTMATMTHTFMKRGTFQVQLTVTDNKGATSTTGKTVTIT